jgi:hypothetical protein
MLKAIATPPGWLWKAEANVVVDHRVQHGTRVFDSKPCPLWDGDGMCLERIAIGVSGARYLVVKDGRRCAGEEDMRPRRSR